MTPFQTQLEADIEHERLAAGNPMHVNVIRMGNPRNDDEIYDVTLFIRPKFLTGQYQDLVTRLSTLFEQPPYITVKHLDDDNIVGWTVTTREQN